METTCSADTGFESVAAKQLSQDNKDYALSALHPLLILFHCRAQRTISTPLHINDLMRKLFQYISFGTNRNTATKYLYNKKQRPTNHCKWLYLLVGGMRFERTTPGFGVMQHCQIKAFHHAYFLHKYPS